MFTGLIEDVGILRDRHRSGDAGKLVVETNVPLAEIEIGDSIAVNGACLTVETKDTANRYVTFHTLTETLKRTNLGLIPAGAKVNLERAMRLGDRLGGHLVSGHIDCTSRILDIVRSGSDYTLELALPNDLAPLLIWKGSIAIDGISLTVASLQNDKFSVNIIPHTWKRTNLESAEPGTRVNLEADMIGKFVLRQRETEEIKSRRLTMDDLHSAGFQPE